MNVKVLVPVLLLSLSAKGAPAIQDFRLPNGLRVLLAENHERPLVRLEMRTAWEPTEEPLGKEGITGFLAQVLDASGVGPYSREGFHRFLEERALRFSFSMEPRHLAWSVFSDSQGQDAAFQSLSLAVTRPVLDATIAGTQRERMLQELKERSPAERAEDRFRASIGDPGNVLFPSESTLGRIEISDLDTLLHRIVRPERTVLVIQGDMNLAQARQLTMLHFGAWGPRMPQLDPVTQRKGTEPLQPTRIWMVRKAGTTLEIRLGAPSPAGAPMSAFSCFACAWLAKRELTTRLAKPFEFSEFQPLANGAWMITLKTTSGTEIVDALRAVRQLVSQLRETKIEAPEWAAAREAWRMESRLRSLHPREEAAFLADQALPDSSLQDWSRELSPEETQSAMDRLFNPEGVVYFVAGAVPGDTAPLEKAGFGPVEMVK